MRSWTQADAHDLAMAVSTLADKVLYWKDRALRAETAERMFATEIYALAAGSRRVKTPKAVECEASQSGPKGNAQKVQP